MDKVTGYVTGVNGNLVAATFSGSVRKNEVGYVQVGDDRLKGEVIRVNGDTASMQIYEMTNGIQVGDRVELSGELMSVELGPGLLTQVFDGLQNPLPELAQQCGFFLQRGVYLDPIPNKDWEFTPLVKPGDHVSAGDAVGSVPEGLFTHLIMVPFGLKDEGWRVKSVREKGVYNVRDTVAVLENDNGEEKELTMVFSWPVKQPIRCYEERLRPDETLVTKLRSIDTFLPVAKGGTFCVPGPFGAGKTVLQRGRLRRAGRRGGGGAEGVPRAGGPPHRTLPNGAHHHHLQHLLHARGRPRGIGVHRRHHGGVLPPDGPGCAAAGRLHQPLGPGHA